MNDFDKFRYFTYLLNTLKAETQNKRIRPILAQWLSRYDDLLGISLFTNADPRPRADYRIVERQVDLEEWSSIERQLKELRETFSSPSSSLLSQNIAFFSDFLGLDFLEKKILGLLVDVCLKEELSELIVALAGTVSYRLDYPLAFLLDVTPSEISDRMTLHSRLAGCGIVQDAPFTPLSFRRGTLEDFFFTPTTRKIARVLAVNQTSDIQELLERLIGKRAIPSLLWEDFDHLGKERNFLAALLNGAIQTKAIGINILLYGSSGTGKTEFCKTLAHQLDASLFEVGNVNEEGREPNRSDRIRLLRLSQQILSYRERSILLFDEMEDLLMDNYPRWMGRSSSKNYDNILLEKSAVPVLWTCNSIESFDPALLRRMTFAMEMRVPPRTVRQIIWSRTLEKEGFSFKSGEIEQLAHEFETAPAFAINAVKAASLANGSIAEIRMALHSMNKASLGGQEPIPVEKMPAGYDPNLVNADGDLDLLEKTMTGPTTQRNFSLYLSGPSGTGKSAFVRFLADRMKMPLHHKRASDLLGMYVGQSEKNIARAFAEALNEQAFLVFDEADSLLANRQQAQRTWEVSQVNEMLTWMENHSLPFACTTNMVERIDPAALRRFTFKSTFSWLTPNQVKHAFQIFFGGTLSSSTTKLDRLTPGDFAVVRRKAEILGLLSDHDVLINMLTEECVAKPGMKHSIGFNVR